MGCATTSRVDTQKPSLLEIPSNTQNTNPPLPSFLEKWKTANLADLEKMSVSSDEKSIGWWKTYLVSTAKKTTAPAQACEGFKKLAVDMEFPLRDLALLRAYEACPMKEKLPPLPQQVNPWYRDLSVEIKWKQSQDTTDLKDDLDALSEKAQIESNKKLKEDYLLKALGLAEKLNLKNEIGQLQAQLYKNSPRLNPDPAFKDLSAVALDYRFHREFDKALKIYKNILSNNEATLDDQFQAYKNIRMTYKVAQRKTEYIHASSDLVNWSKKQFKEDKKDRKVLARFHDTQVLFARTLWTEDQGTYAMKVLNETHKLLRGLHPMDEVYFIMGRMEEEKGHFDKALEYFEASYEQPVSQASLRDKVIWLKAWNYYKLKKWPEARKSFEQMKLSAKEPSDIQKARFWLARTLKNLNDLSAANKELEDLCKEDPLGYYGMLAYRELGRKYPLIKASTNETSGLSLLAVKELNPSLRMSIEWLIAVNEKSFAEKALNQAAEDLKGNRITSETTWLAMSSGFARAGLYLPLFSTLGALQPEVKDRLLNDHPDLLFPQPYADIVSEASVKSKITREFIYSIIRQESAFNPEARSAADAFGLMQLLPSVAKNLASGNNLQYQEALDLYKPEINIPLGAFELKTLMKKYNNQYILAVSGYNANDGAIRGWLKTRFRNDPVEFIEEVPYEETRAYIKLTMRNYVFYQRLLNPGNSIQFPEDLLKMTN